MAARRIIQAMREILTAALTDPQISYYQDQGGGSGYTTLLLPTTSVVPRSVYELVTPPPPSPYVCFAVKGRGSTSRYIADRRLDVTFWVVSEDEDQVTELYEAIRSRVNFGDQDTGFYATNLTRGGTAGTLGAIVREFIETDAYPPTYDRVTARWQLVAEYAAIAA